MSDHVFQDAYARVRSRYSEQAWLNLSPRQITNAIYIEIRQIDRERGTPEVAPPQPREAPTGVCMPAHETMIV